jgi:phosphoesterase RecJ-like protein
VLLPAGGGYGCDYNRGIMSDTLDFDKLHAWLSACQKPLLVTHRRPDGDALGAVAAMAGAVRGLGQSPLPTLYEELAPRYAFIADMPWRRWDTERTALVADCDALIICDTCSKSQLEPVADWLADAPRTLVIDHHPSPEEIGLRDGDLRIIDPTAGAASLIVAEWLFDRDLEVTPAMATALYVGIASDTGWFRFSNADARVHAATSRLLAAGVEPAPLYRQINEGLPAAKLRLIGRMLDSLELHGDGQVAVLSLRRVDFAAADADRSMTEDLINEATRLEGTEVTVLFTEQNDGTVRVNLRSKERVDVSKLAAQFNGGGHARAAGARPVGVWEDIVPQVVEAAIDAATA